MKLYKLAAAGAASMLVAGPASAATFYFAGISGTVVGDGAPGFFEGSPNIPSNSPLAYGVTHTNYQVGANALADNGGTSSSNVMLGATDLSPQNYAQNLLAQSTVFYQINLVGSGQDAVVPVRIQANGAISWNQDGEAEAGFRFNDYTNAANFQTIFFDIRQGDPGTDRTAGNEAFKLDDVFFLKPGDTYSVTLFTIAQANVDIVDPHVFAEESAFADPSFTVVGDFAERWSIEGVPVGDTSTPGVPEPASWALMIAGFGLAGATLRRRSPAPA